MLSSPKPSLSPLLSFSKHIFHQQVIGLKQKVDQTLSESKNDAEGVSSFIDKFQYVVIIYIYIYVSYKLFAIEYQSSDI